MDSYGDQLNSLSSLCSALVLERYFCLIENSRLVFTFSQHIEDTSLLTVASVAVVEKLVPV